MIIMNIKILMIFKLIYLENNLGIGDWGLGIGDWGFWCLGQTPKTQPQKPKPKNKKKKNFIKKKKKKKKKF